MKECNEIIHFWQLAWCLAHTLVLVLASESESLSLLSLIMKAKQKRVQVGVLSKGALRWKSLMLTELF